MSDPSAATVPVSPMEQLLALEMVRVTEAAAIASARFMGKGMRDEADLAATEAMRRTMDQTDITWPWSLPVGGIFAIE